MRAPRPPRAVLRRIDRLSRAAHRFHRFAHHPLCAAYEGEVYRLGPRARVCRGCTLALVGGAAGLGAGLAARPSLLLGLGALAAGLLLLPLRHGDKWRSRFAPALATGFGAASGVIPLAAAALIVFMVLRGYRRRGPDRTPCLTCAERSAQPCSGVSPIVRRERAFQRRASALWDAGARPRMAPDEHARPLLVAPPRCRRTT